MFDRRVIGTIVFAMLMGGGAIALIEKVTADDASWLVKSEKQCGPGYVIISSMVVGEHNHPEVVCVPYKLPER